MIEGPEEVKQCIEIVLGTNKEEWFLNPELGVDRLKILDKSTDEQARHEIIQGIAQEPRIDTIDEIDITVDKGTRTRYISFSATLTNGDTIESEVTIDA